MKKYLIEKETEVYLSPARIGFRAQFGPDEKTFNREFQFNNYEWKTFITQIEVLYTENDKPSIEDQITDNKHYFEFLLPKNLKGFVRLAVKRERVKVID